MTYPGQQYAPQYPGAPAPQQPAMPAIERPALGAPSGGSGINLSPRNLLGRACLMIVHRVDLNAEHLGKRRPSFIGDIYVIDGDGPVIYGDKQGDAPSPPTHRMELPAFFPGVLMSGGWVDRIAQYAGTGRPVGGRWRLGDKVTNGNKAIMFVSLGGDLDPRAAEGAAIGERLIDLLVAHRSGQWTPPEPVSLIPTAAVTGVVPAGTSSMPQVNYGPPIVIHQTPGLPSLPQVPKLPAEPPAPEGWHPKLAEAGWTTEQWAGAYPGMDAATRGQWLNYALQPTH